MKEKIKRFAAGTVLAGVVLPLYLGCFYKGLELAERIEDRRNGRIEMTNSELGFVEVEGNYSTPRTLFMEEGWTGKQIKDYNKVVAGGIDKRLEVGDYVGVPQRKEGKNNMLDLSGRPVYRSLEEASMRDRRLSPKVIYPSIVPEKSNAIMEDPNMPARVIRGKIY